ncbi:MAG: polyprenol monophosphomannose synthase [Planctomycetaceae bacterium]
MTSALDTTEVLVTADVLVAVCTYNEAANVQELVQRVFAALPDCHLLIVDDDSPDGTGKWVQQAMQEERRLKLIIRRDERGLGGATRTALQYAVDHAYRFVLNLDGDLSHNPSALPGMLEVARTQPDVDIVVGSRYTEAGTIQGWPLRRRLMSRVVNRFATLVLGLPVSDCSGSIRCYRVDALARLDPATLQSESYAILEEILVRLRNQGAKMVEVPIQFIDRAQGSSKLTTKETLRSAWQLINVAMRSRSSAQIGRRTGDRS